MAVYWLDLVRFGRHGRLITASNVSCRPYRDYVIDAFNQNCLTINRLRAIGRAIFWTSHGTDQLIASDTTV